MKKISKLLLLFGLTTLTAFGGSGCNVNLSVNNVQHDCLYEELSPVQLTQENTDVTTHLIEKNNLLALWATDCEQPTFYSYAMAHDYTIAEGTQIKLGKNVYVGICMHSAQLIYTEDQIVLSYADTEEETEENDESASESVDSELQSEESSSESETSVSESEEISSVEEGIALANEEVSVESEVTSSESEENSIESEESALESESSVVESEEESSLTSENDSSEEVAEEEKGEPISGLYTYDCTHACYATLKVAKFVSEDYLSFTYQRALAKGITAIEVPAGNYAMAEAFEVSKWFIDGKLTLVDPSNTEICFNNATEEFVPSEILALQELDIKTVYDVCVEDFEDHSTHTCKYRINGEQTFIGLDQKLFDSILSLYASGDKELTVSENPNQNYYFLYLKEDVATDVAFTVPDGVYYAICKNGFDFNAPNLKNLYVYDCQSHACWIESSDAISTSIQSGFYSTQRFSLWQSGTEILVQYAKDCFNFEGEIVLPSGDYALMEDFDVDTLPFAFDENSAYTLCLNGYQIDGFTFGENVKICDCTQNLSYTYEDGDTQETVDVEKHTCPMIHPHVTAVDLNEAVLSTIVDSYGFCTLRNGEYAVSVTSDITTGGTMIIPTGTILHVCLNGHKIYGTLDLAESSFPYMFKVEYGAELHVYDCSADKTGALLSVTIEMGEVEDANISNYASPIYNVGKTVLDGVTSQGMMGVYNAGWLTVKNSKIIGLYGGLFAQRVDETVDVLHTQQIITNVINSEIYATCFATMSVSPNVLTIKDTQIYTSCVGIFDLPWYSDGDFTDLYTTTFENVEINVTDDYEIIEGAGQSMRESMADYIGPCGVYTWGNVHLTGDLNINVDEDAVRPYVDDKGNICEMFAIDFYLYTLATGATIEVDDRVTLTDTFDIYLYNNNEELPTKDVVISNTDISENFFLLLGMSAVNEKGQFVLVVGDTSVMENTITYNVAVNLDGYVRLELYFEFDTSTTEGAEKFLPNENARVILNVVDDSYEIAPNSMGKVGDYYFYFVDFYAKDYQDKIRIRYTNGKYTWTDYIPVSVQDFLEVTLLQLEDQIQTNYDTYSQALAERESASTSTDTTTTTTYTITDETMATAKRSYEEGLAYKNAVLAMINYCDAAAYYFGVQDEYLLAQSEFAYKIVESVTDEATQTTTTTESWSMVSVTDEMNKVTAENLKEYQATVKENSVLPQGVTFIGTSLILNSGTYIRCYFRLSADVCDKLTITIDGNKTELIHYAENSTIYYVQVENLSAMQLKNMYEISITDGTDTFAFTYGVFSYMYGVLNNTEASDALVNVAKATWLYSYVVDDALDRLDELSENVEVAS